MTLVTAASTRATGCNSGCEVGWLADSWDVDEGCDAAGVVDVDDGCNAGWLADSWDADEGCDAAGVVDVDDEVQLTEAIATISRAARFPVPRC